jgi:hypothetical protein
MDLRALAWVINGDPVVARVAVLDGEGAHVRGVNARALRRHALDDHAPAQVNVQLLVEVLLAR